MSEATWEVVEITTGVGRVPKWQVRGPGFSATFRDERVARLIAAAPDLISRLEEAEAFICAMFGRGDDAVVPESVTLPLGVQCKLGDIVRDIKAAIAKARGTP